MNYGSCGCCNKLIKYDKLSLCEDCKNNYLHSVKDYIYENGLHTSEQIHNATKVPIRVIEYFVNNGYLNSKNDSNDQKKLNDEELLKKLALVESLKDSFNQDDNEKKEEITGEMHFLGRNKGR